MPDGDVTHLLRDARDGGPEALERLIPLVYDELRRVAAARVGRERKQITLQATALVHEAWMRIAQMGPVEWRDRTHFFGIASHIMRQILIEQARSRQAQKRGGAEVKVPLNEALDASADPDRELLAVDEALQSLAQIDERKARVIELRYFGGLTVEEMAEFTGISPATIGRDLRMAHAWLSRELQKKIGAVINFGE